METNCTTNSSIIDEWFAVHLQVDGMMCQRNCGSTVQRALSNLPGVSSAEASFEHAYACVKISSQSLNSHYCNGGIGQLQKEALDAVEAVGFDALLIDPDNQRVRHHTVHLHVQGMMCQKNCGATVENALLATTTPIAAVTDAKAVFAQSYATVTYRLHLQTHASPSASLTQTIATLEDQAVDAVEAVGFDASVIQPSHVTTFLQQQEQSVTSHTTSTENTLEGPIDDDLDGNSATLSVKGMSCAVCVGRVEGLIKGIEGVSSARVTLTTHRATVQVTPHQSIQDIAEKCASVVTKGGYDCTILQVGIGGISLADNAAQMEDSRKHELHTWRSLLVTSTLLTVPLMVLHYHQFKCLHDIGIPFCQEGIQFLLSTLVQIVVGKRYYMAAWKGWSNGRFLGMDFLVVMGTTAAYLFAALIFAKHLIQHDEYSMNEAAFETAAMLFTFVTLGKFLESYAKGKTASALQTLMELQPDLALKITNMPPPTSDAATAATTTLNLSSLQTVAVSTNDVRVGDYLYVLPGSRIPSDGVLIATSGTTMNSAYVDESALSGEPFPVAKGVNDPVFGATVNQLSTLVVRVTAAGNSTVLAKIVRLMEQAQSQKAPIEAQADRVACIFAPTVMGLAGLTLVGWLVFYHAHADVVYLAIMSSISVIVVACPCALGLATPTAVMVGTGVGASHGLLIKGGAVLEGAHAVDTIIFDKTGTLTTGKAVVKDHVQLVTEHDHDVVRYRPACVEPHQVCLWLAACAEKQSEHPLAKAICNAAAQTPWGGANITCNAKVQDFLLVPGSGVECLVIVDGAPNLAWTVRVGNKAYVTAAEENGPDKPCAGEAEMNDIRHRGQVGVYVSVVRRGHTDDTTTDRTIIGVIGIADPIEQEAPSTIAALHRMGVSVWMCTGDHHVTAMAVAQQVGIPPDHVCAGVKPEGKADLVSRLQKSNATTGRRRGQRDRGRRHVAFVGDGINDAVALARSDVGIAIGAGTEVAVEAADIVLVRSSLHDVVVALHLSRVVFFRIRMNFVWAMGYNLVALPFAAGVFFPLTHVRLPPQFAGLMMAFSSVSVVTSSLLLRFYSKPTIRSNGRLAFQGLCWKLSSCHACRDKNKNCYSMVSTYEEEEATADEDLFHNENDTPTGGYTMEMV